MAHRYLGYTALSVVLFRILISNKKKVTYYNPKAKYVYWSIWACIFSLATTGFMMGLDYFWGSQRLEDIHNVISNILLGLVFIHLCGVFLDAWINKRKTWMVMITGRKES